jgi:hypothetical protein
MQPEHQDTNAILTKIIAELPEVKSYLSELENQDLWWTTVAMVGKINNQNIDPQLLVSIVETQVEFQKLRDKMMASIIERYQQQAQSDLQLKTQAIIDTINRNLFERTADVGFLAEDLDIKHYLSQQEPANQDRDEITHLLAEYVAKYSVYDDVALIYPNNELACSLTQTHQAHRLNDPFFNGNWRQQDQYFEYFGPCSLYPEQSHVLLYIKAIKQDHKLLGYLLLKFKFNDEMVGIFSTLSQRNSAYNMRLTDPSGLTLASNNPTALPLFKRMKEPQVSVNPSVQNATLLLARKTKGYEGYLGLDWLGEISIDFKDTIQIDIDNSLSIEANSPLFLEDLTNTNLMVKNLLLIVILNGKINSLKREVSAFLPVLESFQEISQTISDTFNRFINHLHQVILSIVSNKLDNSALFSADIMDRNLYERANDVRWWALNGQLKACLALENTQDPSYIAAQAKAQKTLIKINQLYTVYTNLLLIDRNHNIVAVSDTEQHQWVGTQFEHKNDLSQCFNINSTQDYHVSSFEPTPYYNKRPTYIYYAPIKNGNTTLGAIAIVFDSEPQFRAILDDFAADFNRDELKNLSFSAFVTHEGRVIASNHQQLQPNQRIKLPEKLKTFTPGKAGQVLLELEGERYLCSFFMGRGYREFKNTDGYQNHVITLAAIRF